MCCCVCNLLCKIISFIISVLFTIAVILLILWGVGVIFYTPETATTNAATDNVKSGLYSLGQG